MAQEKFYDILVKELRAQIRHELEEELARPLASIQTQSFDIPIFTSPKVFAQKKSSYPKSFKQPAKPENQEACIKREMTAEERAYYEIFLKLGAHLSERFKERELKREFRKLAHKYHPDHQIKADASHLQLLVERFNEVRICYDKLCKTLEK